MRSISVRGWVTAAAILGLGAAPQSVSLSGQIGSTVVIPLGDDAAGFGGSATAPDLQRGEVVYSLHSPQLAQPTNLVTEATFLVSPSEKSRLFDDPVSARLYRGRVVSIVRIPSDQGLLPGVDYALQADRIRGSEVTPLAFAGTLTLLPEKVAILRSDARLVQVGGTRPRSKRWEWLSSWLPSRSDPTAPAGMDLAVSVPRPALQLQWSWSGGPRIEGEPLVLNDGPNKIFGVDLSVRYPARQIDIVRVVPPPGRDLVIWHQDDGAGQLSIQAVSHDGMSVNHLEVVFELQGNQPLDPADPIDGVEFTITKAVDPLGAPVDGGEPEPWSLELSDVTVR